MSQGALGGQEGQSPGCWGPTWERTRELEGGWRSARGWQSPYADTSFRPSWEDELTSLSPGCNRGGGSRLGGGGSLPGLACILSELGGPPTPDRCRGAPDLQGVIVLGAGSGLHGAQGQAGAPDRHAVSLVTLPTWTATPRAPQRGLTTSSSCSGPDPGPHS